MTSSHEHLSISNSSSEHEQVDSDSLSDIFISAANNHQIILQPLPDKRQRGWSKRLFMTVTAAVCFLSNALCLIIGYDNWDKVYGVLIFGLIEGLIFSFYCLFKFILCLEGTQRFLRTNKTIERICSKMYKNYDKELLVFKIPNAEKLIEDLVVHEDYEDKVNISPIEQLYKLYKQFCITHKHLFTVLSATLGIVSFFIAFIQLFLYLQSVLSFKTVYTQVLIFTVLTTINSLLFFFFLLKLAQYLFFFGFQLQYILIYKYSSVKLFVMIFLSIALSIMIAHTIECVEFNFISLTLFFVLIACLITVILFTSYKFILFIIRCIFLKMPFKRILINIYGAATKKWKMYLCFFVLSLCLLIATITSLIVSISIETYSQSTPDTFHTVNYDFSDNYNNVFNEDIDPEMITFGIGSENYFRKYYANPTISTPTINLSNMLELSLSSTDYYGTTSKALPMNGIVYYPSDIFSLETTRNVVVILADQINNLVQSELGYEYIQKTLAKQGIVTISLDHAFLDVDESGNKVISLTNYTSSETYLQARVLMAIQTINYLYETLNSYFDYKLNFNEIGIVGDRIGGVVAFHVIKTLNEHNTTYIGIEDLNVFNITSFFSMGCSNTTDMQQMENINTYFIEAYPELSAYETPFVSSYFNPQYTNANEYYYSGALIIQKSYPTDFSTKSISDGTYILVEELCEISVSMLSSKETQHIVSKFVSAHFLCSFDENCENLLLLKDFKYGKDVLPLDTAYYNIFHSNDEIMILSNGSLYNTKLSLNVSYHGLFYQNKYQSFNKLLVCDKKLCSITFQLDTAIPGSGISLSFYKYDQSNVKSQFIYINTNDTFLTLPYFTYAPIPYDTSNISKLYLMQTYQFMFDESELLISDFTLYFTGEILIDDVSILK